MAVLPINTAALRIQSPVVYDRAFADEGPMEPPVDDVTLALLRDTCHMRMTPKRRSASSHGLGASPSTIAPNASPEAQMGNMMEKFAAVLERALGPRGANITYSGGQRGLGLRDSAMAVQYDGNQPQHGGFQQQHGGFAALEDRPGAQLGTQRRTQALSPAPSSFPGFFPSAPRPLMPPATFMEAEGAGGIDGEPMSGGEEPLARPEPSAIPGGTTFQLGLGGDASTEQHAPVALKIN